MKVTLDTNILISATFWNGDSSKIINLVEQTKIELILSEEILSEFSAVLNYKEITDKMRDKHLIMHQTVDKIRQISTIVVPEKKFVAIKEDPDDDKILECAYKGKVDYIVSNDTHLLKLRKFSKIQIISSKEFLNLISL
jgi:putative PIN family toxin of toxin-antitoxin system